GVGNREVDAARADGVVDLDPEGIVLDVELAQHDIGAARAARPDEDAGARGPDTIVGDVGVRYLELTDAGGRKGDTGRRAGIEAADDAIVDMQDTGLDEIDTRQAGRDTLDVEAPQIHDAGRGNIHDDPVCA